MEKFFQQNCEIKEAAAEAGEVETQLQRNKKCVRRLGFETEGWCTGNKANNIVIKNGNFWMKINLTGKINIYWKCKYANTEEFTEWWLISNRDNDIVY